MPDGNEFFDIDDISKINLDAIVSQLPGGPWWSKVSSTQGKYVMAFLQSQDTLIAHGLDSALRLAHFLGQGLIETGFLRYTSENLNYSADALRKVFGKYFKTDDDAKAYARQPEKIANRVYGNRMGNGDEASGDGWLYRGRGFIQLTGKDNYKRFATLTGLPIDTDPDLISRDLKASIQVAAKFFEVNGLLDYADLNDAKAVSRGINFGNPNASKPAHCETERIAWTAKALDLFRKEEQHLVYPLNGGLLKIGSKGDKVKEYQRLLAGLGYAVGGIDGDYGPATSRVVTAFQQEAGIPTTGEIDKVTALAIYAAAEGTPTGTNRSTADVNDLRAQGDTVPDTSNQIGGTAVVVGGAAAAGAAAEILGIGDGEGDTPDAGTTPPTTDTPPMDTTTDPIDTGDTDTMPDDGTSDMITPDTDEVPDITPPVDQPSTNTATETPANPPVSPPGVNDSPNWILIAILGVIVLGAIFVFLRAGKIKRGRVQDYRDGKIV